MYSISTNYLLQPHVCHKKGKLHFLISRIGFLMAPIIIMQHQLQIQHSPQGYTCWRLFLPQCNLLFVQVLRGSLSSRNIMNKNNIKQEY